MIFSLVFFDNVFSDELSLSNTLMASKSDQILELLNGTDASSFVGEINIPVKSYSEITYRTSYRLQLEIHTEGNYWL